MRHVTNQTELALQIALYLDPICSLIQIWNIRCLAARLLGECVGVMCSPEFPAGSRKSAFHAVFSQLVRVFPADLGNILRRDPTALDSSHYVPPHQFRYRIHMLHASVCFLGCPEALTSATMGYMDRLLSNLLRPQVHHYLQAAAIHALHAHLPVTNRNRLRVEQIFREPIMRLSVGLFPTDQHASGSPPGESTPIHGLVKKELALFWAVWYPKPADAQLRRVVPSQDQLTRLTDGYAFRRWQLLVANAMQKTEEDQSDDMDTDSRTAAQSIIKQPYQMTALASAALKLELFESRSPDMHRTEGGSPYGAVQKLFIMMLIINSVKPAQSRRRLSRRKHRRRLIFQIPRSLHST